MGADNTTISIQIKGDNQSQSAIVEVKTGLQDLQAVAEKTATAISNTFNVQINQQIQDFSSGLAVASDGTSVLALAMGGVLADSIEKVIDLTKDLTKEVIQGGIESNTQVETFTAKFQVLLGSADAAKAKMDELQQVGFINPEQLIDIDKMDIGLTQVGLDSANTAQLIGISGDKVRQDILNTATAVADGAADMGVKTQRITNDITKFYETGTSASITDLMRLKAVTRDELMAAGLEFDKHGHVVGDHAKNVGIVLNALGEKYKDLNVVSMNTMAGLTSNWEDLKAYLERTITGALFDSFKSGMKDVLDIFGSAEAKQAYQDMSAGIKEIIDSFGKLFGSVGDNKSLVLEALDGIAKAIIFVGDAADYLATHWSSVEENFFAPISHLVSDAEVWGNNIIVSFANGMEQGIGSIVGVIGDISSFITDSLESHSPPKILPNLTIWGKGAVDSYFDGWKMADFAAFDGIKAEVSSRIKDMMPEKGESAGAIKMIIGTDAAVADALSQFEKVGTVSARTYKEIEERAGAAGGRIVEFVKAEFDDINAQKEVAAAAKEVADAQAKVAEINQRYKDLLDPLDDKLKIITSRMTELKDQTAAATQGDKDHLQDIQDQAEAYAKLADVGINNLKGQIEALNLAQQKLKDSVQDATQVDRDHLQDIQDQAEAYKTLADVGINNLKSQIEGLNDAQQKIKDSVAAATAALRDHLETVQNDAAEYKSLSDIDIAPLKDQVAQLAQAQQDLNDKMTDQTGPLQAQVDIINGQEKQIANAKALKDAQDLANGTGSHKFDLQKAELAVQKDATDSQIEALRYQSEMDKTQASINSGKLNGNALEQAKIHLQEIQLAHQQKLMDMQLKSEQDKEKLSDMGSGGGAAEQKAQAEAKKLALESQIIGIKDAHAAEAQALKEKEQGAKEELKNALAIQKARMDSYKEEENITKSKIKGIEDGAKAQEKAIELQKHALQDQLKDQEALEKAKMAGFKAEEDVIKDRIKSVENAAKLEERGMEHQKHALTEQLKAQEAVKNAQMTIFKAEEDATQDIIKAKENASKLEMRSLNEQQLAIKAQEDTIKNAKDAEMKGAEANLKVAQEHKKVADEHKKAADEHLKIMQAQTKELTDQVKLAKELATAQAGHAGHAGKAGGIAPLEGGGISRPPPKLQQATDGSDWAKDPTAAYKKSAHDSEMHKPFQELEKTLKDLTKQLTDTKANIDSFVSDANSKWNNFKGVVMPILHGAGDELGKVGHFMDQVAAIVKGTLSPAFAGFTPPLAEIRDEFGKLGEKMGPSFTKLWDAITRAVTDLKPVLITLGVVAISPIIALITGLTAVVGGLLQGFDSALPGIELIFTGFATAVTGYINGITDLFTGLGTVVDDIMNKRWSKALDDAWSTVKNFAHDVGQVWLGLGEMLAGSIGAALGFVVGYFYGMIKSVIDMATGLYDTLVGHSIFPDLAKAILKTFTDMVTWVTNTVSNWITDLVNTVTNLASDIQLGFNTIKDHITQAIKDAIATALSDIDKFILDFLGKITSLATSIYKAAQDVGKNISDGITKGIKDAWHTVTDTLHNLAAALPKPIQDALNIQSPSRTMADLVGRFIPEGVASGIEEHTNTALDAARKMGERINGEAAQMHRTTTRVSASGLETLPIERNFQPTNNQTSSTPDLSNDPTLTTTARKVLDLLSGGGQKSALQSSSAPAPRTSGDPGAPDTNTRVIVQLTIQTINVNADDAPGDTRRAIFATIPNIQTAIAAAVGSRAT